MKKSKKVFFTLTEVLVTIAIIAFLIGISIGGMSVAVRIASDAKCKAMIKKFEIAAESYRSKMGYYPQEWDRTTYYFYMDSNASSAPTPNFNDFFPVQDSELRTVTGTFSITRGRLSDPWTDYYFYKNPGTKNPTKFDFGSYGADGKPGTVSVNDNGAGAVDDILEFGWQNTDDIGNFQ